MAKIKTSLEDMLTRVQTHRKRHLRNSEHRLQCACVQWFRLQYPSLSRLLFAVPNGGRRDASTGRILKEEGVVPGVADLILLVPTRTAHALCIEMKTASGRQTAEQKAWQKAVTDKGYDYVLCRCFGDFQVAINKHLCNNQDG